jgi:iron complex transport system substrate-binding protein
MREPHDPRVVSLIASATEIVHAIGAGEMQVGRSHECDWPPAVLDIPALTRPKFKVDGSSRDIDQAVRSLVEQGLSVGARTGCDYYPGSVRSMCCFAC